ncbi:hypothetical protein BCR33DRAFT_486441 [Rhizoclosmatium globosum]|uniref:Uncharacterized protein n=1 Tax=Rhizoclosmatium globosum TaxID=329046 RepID=A0A1Y2BN56_9FUNG|nr:hypothetical protein BCR33DRAFT_486441 [Rhizoclosmatium globosum]|eukprot:ORY36198.1 hypothetical protein BCR33DRAFT_486441 [Rhizoclosmatium globosum]
MHHHQHHHHPLSPARRPRTRTASQHGAGDLSHQQGMSHDAAGSLSVSSALLNQMHQLNTTTNASSALTVADGSLAFSEESVSVVAVAVGVVVGGVGGGGLVGVAGSDKTVFPLQRADSGISVSTDSVDECVSVPGCTAEEALQIGGGGAVSPDSLVQVVRSQIRNTSTCHQTLTSNSTSNSNSTSTASAANNISRLPHELLARIFLLLSNPTRLASASTALYTALHRDAFLLAAWLAVHNHFVPVSICPPLRPPAPVHPLLAALKHPLRVKLIARKPDVAHMLLRIDPFVSRYELQRMYRRAFSLFNKCTDIVSSWGLEIFGEEIRATVPFQKPSTITLPQPAQIQQLPQNPPMQPEQPQQPPPPQQDEHIPHFQLHTPQPIIQITAAPNEFLVATNTTTNINNSANPGTMDPILETDEDNSQLVQTLDPHNNPVQIQQPSQELQEPTALRPNPLLAQTRPVFPVDDRRLLLDAADTGDISTLRYLLTQKALLLDPRVIADAFSRAWDNGDPFHLCTPHTGLLWPRCSASRFYVLEKVVQEEDEVVTVFLMQTPGGVPEQLELGEEIVETIVHAMKVCWEIIEDERRGCVAGSGFSFYGKRRGGGVCDMEGVVEGKKRHDMPVSRSCDVLLSAGILGEVLGADVEEDDEEMQGLEYLVGTLNETVFRGRKRAIDLDLWGLPVHFLQRAFDAFVVFGSVRMVALLMSKYSEYIEVRPCHVTAALDRISLPLLSYLADYCGADLAGWEEDASLASCVRKPGDPSIIGGPMPSPAALDSAGRTVWSWALRRGVVVTERRWEGIVKLGPQSVGAVIEFYGPTVFDPCRDNMLGFRIGSAPVVKALSRAIDAKFSQGSRCVLFEAAVGDACALYFVTRLGDLLVEDLKNGEKERVMELLDAGAIVGDQVLLAAAAIADMPPGKSLLFLENLPRVLISSR